MKQGGKPWFSLLSAEISVLLLSSVRCLLMLEPPDSCETMVTPVQISLRCPAGKLLTQPWQQS